MKTIDLRCGDCLEVLKTISDNSIDSIITDPPYGLKFMGKKWDYNVPKVEIWEECLRVLKPGGHLLAFAGTRTQHRMAVNIEDAGFEIRDMLAWVYGSGFPKSLNIGKAIDKQSDEGKQWDGWGTALKPALEPITLARKPISENTIANNVLKWGVSGINIEKCRVGDEKLPSMNNMVTPERIGRFPSNFIHDGSEEIDEAIGEAKRFFYCIKATKKDRGEGLNDFEKQRLVTLGGASREGRLDDVSERFRTRPTANNHPTVKPTNLMQYLIRLITPSQGTCLDPFMGSGSTGKACVLEGFNFIGIELEEEYFKIAEARINNFFNNKEEYLKKQEEIGQLELFAG